jgi:hypothetical protein
VLTVPANTIVEATGPTGAVVTFTLPTRASDAVDGSDAVSCSGGTSGATFPLGTTTITCSSTDHAGNTAAKSFTVTVRDTTAPAILSVTPSVTKLWPPNGARVPVTIAVSARDLVTASSTCQIVSVSSNQPHRNQWTITGPLTLSLVADRDGSSDRIYTIQVTCADAAGNTSPRSSATVTVTKK